MNTGKRTWSSGSTLSAYLFILPFLAAFSVFFVFPAGYSLFLSFSHYRGYGPTTWAGLDNYATVLTYAVFWWTLGNTFFYWVAHMAPMMGLAFILAVTAHRKIIRWERHFRTIIFFPQLMAPAAAAMVFQNMFGQDYGAVNAFLHLRIAWLTDPWAARWTVVFLMVWRGTGYWFVVFLAALTTVPPEVEEAALLDGASALQRLVYVTLPLIRPTLIFAMLIDAIYSLRLYTEPYLLLGTAGASPPPSVAPTLTLLVDAVRSGEFGMAGAIGWLLFLMTVAISGAISILLRQRGEANAG